MITQNLPTVTCSQCNSSNNALAHICTSCGQLVGHDVHGMTSLMASLFGNDSFPETATETIQYAVSRVLNSGLYESSEDSHFSWAGCDNCADGLGAEVYDVHGYTCLEMARKGKDFELDFQICGDCLCNAANGMN